MQHKKTFIRITPAVSVIIVLAGLLLFGFYQKDLKKPAYAKLFGGPLCDMPIPTSASLMESNKLRDEVLAPYQNAVDIIDDASAKIQGILSALDSNEKATGKACDFSKCNPQAAFEENGASPGQTTNIGPQFSLKIEAYIARAEAGIRPPFCVAGQCEGDPCSLSQIQTSITGLKGNQLPGNNAQAVRGALEKIQGERIALHDAFSKPTEQVTEDTRVKAGDAFGRPEEGEGQLITKQEMVVRQADWAASMVNLCSLTYLEQKRAEAGKYGFRFPMRCQEAIDQGIYWPKPWSEKCQKQCYQGSGEECAVCLGKCEGNSVLANINCKIFSSGQNEKCAPNPNSQCCGEQCSEGIGSKECQQCLCQGLTKEQCRDWLCAGSKNNFVCCDENTSPQFESYYVSMYDYNADYESGGVDKTETNFTGGSNSDWQKCLYKGNNAFMTNAGQQLGESSDALKNLLLDCIAGKLDPGKTGSNGLCANWFVTSLSDSNGIATRDKHSKTSCHYGGPQGTAEKPNTCNNMSFAADLDVIGDNFQALEQAALACKQNELADRGVCVYEEENHLHVSINTQNCLCDVKCGKASGVCHKTWLGYMSCD
ncbi:MAG: hypothetical protein M1127_00985 [Patescibacteria group bacterium]|nr:hypothetical protein [Patescibacteria group bacterium]